MLNDSAKLDRAFQALADPARRGMLARLACGPASVSELAEPLRMSLPAVLQHLRQRCIDTAGIPGAMPVTTRVIMTKVAVG